MNQLKRILYRPFEDSQSGMSLLDVIVAMAALLTIISIASNAKVKSEMASKMIDASSSYAPHLSSVTSFFGQTVIDNATELCAGNLNVLNSLVYGDIDVKPIQIVEVEDEKEKEMLSRCTKPLLEKKGNLFFCLDFAKSLDAPEGTFTGSEKNVAELAVNFVDKWQRPISCTKFLTADKSQVGVQILYRLYWKPDSKQTRPFQKFGYYYAIKE